MSRQRLNETNNGAAEAAPPILSPRPIVVTVASVPAVIPSVVTVIAAVIPAVSVTVTAAGWTRRATTSTAIFLEEFFKIIRHKKFPFFINVCGI